MKSKTTVMRKYRRRQTHLKANSEEISAQLGEMAEQSLVKETREIIFEIRIEIVSSIFVAVTSRGGSK